MAVDERQTRGRLTTSSQLAFAAIVAGITGSYLHFVRGSSSWHEGRFIYTEVVAGLSIVLSVIWLFPFAGSFIHYPADIIISICWFVAFGLLVNVSLLPRELSRLTLFLPYYLLTHIQPSDSPVLVLLLPHRHSRTGLRDSKENEEKS